MKLKKKKTTCHHHVAIHCRYNSHETTSDSKTRTSPARRRLRPAAGLVHGVGNGTGLVLAGARALQCENRGRVLVEVFLQVNVVLGVAVVVVEDNTGAAEREE
jgi:hypothetical protein